MASHIVKDSNLSIFVKQVKTPADAQVNDLIAVGAVRGLVGHTPQPGDDGSLYATVDTAAHIRVSDIAIAFTDKATVYLTPGGAISGSSSGNAILGYAERPKTAASGDLHIQLVPSAV